MSDVKNLIDNISNGNYTETEDVFNSIMASKVSDKLDAMRIDVAKNLFKEQPFEEHPEVEAQAVETQDELDIEVQDTADIPVDYDVDNTDLVEEGYDPEEAKARRHVQNQSKDMSAAISTLRSKFNYSNEKIKALKSHGNNLGHIAATHYKMSKISSSDRYKDDKNVNQRSKSHIKNLEKHVAKHHGQEVVDALRKNTNSAIDHERSMYGKDLSHHNDFVNKHLGGKGSQDHKEYTKQVKSKNVYDHEKNSNHIDEAINKKVDPKTGNTTVTYTGADAAKRRATAGKYGYGPSRAKSLSKMGMNTLKK